MNRKLPRVLLFNKPYNVLSQFTDGETRLAHSRETLAHYLDVPGLRPAGRLDRDSEGLLVLTDSGALIHQLTSPEHALTKTYWAQVEGEPNQAALDELRGGVELGDGPCRPARVDVATSDPWFLWPRTPPIRYRKNVADTWLSLTISEGRNRQVRRMCAAVGLPVLRLIRYRIGSWTLDGIGPGEQREIS